MYTTPGMRSSSLVLSIAASVLSCGEPVIAPYEEPGPVPVSLVIEPQDVMVVEGRSVQLAATLRDSSGTPIEGTVGWGAFPTEIATVSNSGIVYGHQLGRVNVVASHGALRDTVVVWVQVVFRSVTAGARHTCGVTIADAAYCWGVNPEGRLGDGARRTRTSPSRVADGLHYLDVSAGRQFTCARTAEGAACWGSNRSGQLGSNTKSDALEPLAVAGDLAFVSLSAYAIHACAIEAETGQPYCWGADWAGQLGDGDAEWHARPYPVANVSPLRSIAAGWLFTCGLDEVATIWCWGGNDHGQLGRGDVPDDCQFPAGSYLPCARLPQQIPAERPYASLVAGSGHACALTPGGEAYCWGDNGSGQLGIGTTVSTSTPSSVASSLRFTALTAGDRHTCGLTSDGDAYCWGANAHGALGTSSTFENCAGQLCSTVPVPVSGDLRFALLSASRGDGGSHTCGISVEGVLYCWGSNSQGQLGAGFSGAVSFEPLRVSGQP